MMNINKLFATLGYSPLPHAGEGLGERVFSFPPNAQRLPGVARRLVTFLASLRQRVAVETNLQVMSEPKVTKRRRSPIRHLFEVPCVARQVRLPYKLARSAARPRAQTYSSEFPDQSVLLGGGRGVGKAKTFYCRVGKLPTNYQITAWAICPPYNSSGKGAMK